MTQPPFGWLPERLLYPRIRIVDRLICDHRPQNSQESAVSRVLFLFCPRLRRLILARHWVFTSLTRAIASTFFKLTGIAGTHRSLVQASPPHIEEDTYHEINDANLETWWEPGQVAIVSVMMGDINAGVLRTVSAVTGVPCLKETNSATFTSMTWCSSQYCISLD